MQLKDARIVLTGAGGGIGAALAHELSGRGAALLLVGRNDTPLTHLADTLAQGRHRPLVAVADIATPAGLDGIRNAARECWGGTVDIVVNNAGVMEFGAYETTAPAAIRRLLATNVEAPMQLARQFLPGMVERGAGGVVCVGSILGTLAVPYFTAYSASKFALRGFAEALRRELRDTGVAVCYVGPRSVRTSMNGPAVQRMAAATGMHLDDPQHVARRIVHAMEQGHAETLIGFPESLFARINAALPRLVDRIMVGQRRRMSPFARAGM